MIGMKSKILDYFRSGIISGKFKPGEMLPYRTEIESRFKTTPATVNGAFKELKEDGFIVAKRKWGTMVVEHPPHLNKFAVAFRATPKSSRLGGEWSYYYESLDRAVRQAEHRLNNGISIESFYGVARDHSTEGYRKLSRAIENNCIAGVLFADHPYELVGTPILMKKGLPRIAFATPEMGDSPVLKHIPSIFFSDKEFFDKAMGFLAGRGRRKVAVMFLGAMNKEVVDDFNDIAAKHKMTTRPCWYFFAEKGKDFAACIVRLLLDRNQKEIPDALIIADDHLVEGAMAGAVQAGFDPEKLDIVAYSNFPLVSKTEVGITRICFNSHELLRKSIGLLKDIRVGRKVSSASTVNLAFECDI